MEQGGGECVGDLHPVITQPPLPPGGQVPHEWEGRVPDVRGDVHGPSSSRWKTSLQGFSTPPGRRYQYTEQEILGREEALGAVKKNHIV